MNPARLLALLGLLYASAAVGGTAPPGLSGWLQWVVRDQPELACPRIAQHPGELHQDEHRGDQRRCAWPGELKIDIRPDGAQFSQHWQIFSPGWLPLPGDDQHWPTAVLLDGAPAAVLAPGGRPAIAVQPGTYRVSGELHWQQLPQALPLATGTALVAASADGKPVAAAIGDDNQLWFGQRPRDGDSAMQDNTVRIQVFRLLSDDIPLRLHTEVRLAVSGKPRELVFGQLLPAGAIPISFESPLPTRIEADGRLRVQARAGEWRLALDARFAGAPTEFTSARLDPDWPAQEVWSFRSDPALRGVKLEGPPAVDPSQLDVPPEFRDLPTYLMTATTPLRLVEQYRGDARPRAAELRLDRRLWLDFDGAGATASDRISGRFAPGGRLRTLPALALGRVAVTGGPQLITRVPGEGGAGVEIRHGSIVVEAVSRIASLGALSASAWDTDFSGVNVDLRLPPGWKLWHASGPEAVDASWISSWNLWDLFICLLVVGGTARLLGMGWGVATAALLALSYREAGALLLGWATLVALLALLRVVPTGRLRTLVRAVGAVALLTVTGAVLDFAVQQTRLGLYPQLAQDHAIHGYAGGNAATATAVEADYAAAPAAAPMALDKVLGDAGAPRAQHIRRQPAPRYRPADNVQTGPGEPAWQWRQARLSWSGPVGAQAPLHLYLSPPWLTRILHFVCVALAALVLLALARALVRALRDPGAPGQGASGAAPSTPTSAPAAANLLLPLIIAGGLCAPDASAQEFPPRFLLDELRAELLKAPLCAPACAAVQQVRVEVGNGQLLMHLRAAAGTAIAFPLPLDASWQPRGVLVDGRPATLAQDGGRLWVNLNPGGHDLVLSGAVTGDQIALPFPLPPRNVSVVAPDWDIEGLTGDRVPGHSLLLHKRARGDDSQTLRPAPIAPFVRVERALTLDLDWQLVTTVTRVAPAVGAIAVRIPLLPGEAVVSPGLTVVDNQAVVALNATQTSFEWRSVLPPSAQLRLSAPATSAWVEEWRVQSSPRWHLDEPSLPPIKPADVATGGAAAEPQLWRPWPGETLTLRARQPAAVPGPTTTVEEAALTYRPGARSAALSLELSIRTSLGGDYRVKLAAPNTLQSVAIDGVEQTRRADPEGQVVLALHPGVQRVAVAWELPQTLGVATRTPAIELASPANNIGLRLILPQSRWPLLTRGPAIGPAMLYWGVLAVSALVAIGLGSASKRFGLSMPVNTWQWLLLALGTSTVNGFGAVMVALWFFALEARRRAPMPAARWQFNLIQVGVFALSLLALASLLYTIPQSLLSAPDMQVTSNGSGNYYYRWYQDRSAALLPQGEVLSAPLWVYRSAMLLWSLWLAFAMLAWMRWGWQGMSSGKLWQGRSPPTASATASVAATAPDGASGVADREP